jgi:exopolysaccharide biosynthesis polyprenyl glycosylphosphotransferase
VHPQPKSSDERGVRPVDAIVSQGRPARRRQTHYDAAKRAFDIAVSLTMLALLSPLFLLIAALVKLKSPGPVFFRQERIGQMMKPFMMLKFRTMQVNADHAIHHQFVSSFIKSRGQSKGSGKTDVFKIANDPRVTPIGNFLRRTSLDELPQLWNVLRGDMSLVGPRPPLQYEVEQYQSWHRRRVLEAKPGLTGLWQVSGRSRTTFDEMVRLDLRYARSSSVWTDIKILLATPGAVISGKGAR